MLNREAVGMARLIEQPTVVQAVGNKPKQIQEFIGRVNSSTHAVSIARMVVLRGVLRVDTRSGTLSVRAGQAVIVSGGEWVRYSSPEPEGAEYVAVCLPAFSPETVHRDL
jgi:ethanolamine utilization protein EutQ